MFESWGWRTLAAGLLMLAAVSLNCPGARAQDSFKPAASQPAALGPTSFVSPRWRPEGVTRVGAAGSTSTDDSSLDLDDAGAGAPQTGSTMTVLTPGGKMRRAFKKAFLSPGGYLRTGISAAITQATEEDQPHKTTEDKFADGLSRFAIKTGTRYTRTVLGSGIFPVLFRQDPRYDRSEKKGFGARVLHAVSRVFVTRGDNGSLQPNYSRWAGSLSASALSNLWERSTPGRDRIGVDATFKRFGASFINDAWQLVIFNEFGPDIFRIFRR